MDAQSIMLNALASSITSASIGKELVFCPVALIDGRLTNTTDVRLQVPAGKTVESVSFYDAAGGFVIASPVPPEPFTRAGQFVIPRGHLNITVREVAA